MDTVEFFKTANRLCKDQGCKKCPACKEGACMVMRMIRLDDNSGESIEETISKVEQWAKDHPIKTRQSEFLKKFPNAYLNTITRLLPCELDKTLKPLRCAKYGYLSITCRCDRCRDDYWNEEVTE
nr:MAG TPA: NADH-ubiquinone oxidoreductase [Caudoviricetes sp.]